MNERNDTIGNDKSPLLLNKNLIVKKKTSAIVTRKKFYNSVFIILASKTTTTRKSLKISINIRIGEKKNIASENSREFLIHSLLASKNEKGGP